MELFCGRGFLTMDGDVWRHARRALRSSFAKSNLSDWSILSREVDRIVADLPRNGDAVDFQPSFNAMVCISFNPLMTSNVELMRYSFSTRRCELPVGNFTRRNSQRCSVHPEEFVDAFHDALFLTMIRMMLGRVWKLLPQRRFRRVCNTAHSFLKHYVAQAVGRTGVSNSNSAQSQKRSLVQALSAQSDDQGFIRSQIVQGMMASQETTSSLLENAVFLLSRHPSYWSQVREKVLAKADMFSFDILLSSKVLHNILLESKCYQVHELTARNWQRSSSAPLPGVSPPGSHRPLRYNSTGRGEARSPQARYLYRRGQRWKSDSTLYIVTRASLERTQRRYGPSVGTASIRASGDSWPRAAAAEPASGARRAWLRRPTFLLGWRSNFQGWRVETIRNWKAAWNWPAKATMGVRLLCTRLAASKKWYNSLQNYSWKLLRNNNDKY